MRQIERTYEKDFEGNFEHKPVSSGGTGSDLAGDPFCRTEDPGTGRIHGANAA